jgi:hypothetical protein
MNVLVTGVHSGQPNPDNLEEIISSAWTWQKSHPKGYEEK